MAMRIRGNTGTYNTARNLLKTYIHGIVVQQLTCDLPDIDNIYFPPNRSTCKIQRTSKPTEHATHNSESLHPERPRTLPLRYSLRSSELNFMILTKIPCDKPCAKKRSMHCGDGGRVYLGKSCQ